MATFVRCSVGSWDHITCSVFSISTILFSHNGHLFRYAIIPQVCAIIIISQCFYVVISTVESLKEKQSARGGNHLVAGDLMKKWQSRDLILKLRHIHDTAPGLGPSDLVICERINRLTDEK